MNNLSETAQSLVRPGAGILAADESDGTIKKRFDTIGVASTADTRRAYRELLFTTPGLEQNISGIILFDETIRQSAAGGLLFVDLLAGKGIHPGIKVDKGLEPWVGGEEKVTKGLDGLLPRLEEYAAMGAVFTKWRAVITIGNGMPTRAAIEENAKRLAEFAALSQHAGLIPIVEPEVLIDGNHSIAVCQNVSAATLQEVFQALRGHDVDLRGMLLKPSMVLPGKESPDQVSDQEIARKTVEVLRATVPSEVPGIVFLSGGQNPQQATQRLSLMNEMFKDEPWQLSFSYGRALQDPVLKAWRGSPENVPAAQAALLKRAKLNGQARYGIYQPAMEDKP